MNPAGRQQVMERKSPAVAYFYTATERRSRGVMWPSITPALTKDVLKYTDMLRVCFINNRDAETV
jgi:hypothetical protein